MLHALFGLVGRRSGLLLAIATASCVHADAVGPSSIATFRHAAADSVHGEVVGRWLLAELLVPGGDAKGALAARARLAGLTESARRGLFAAFGRAFDDELHGRLPSAASAYVDALSAARTSTDPDAPLVAWFSVHHLLGLRASVAGLRSHERNIVAPFLDNPGNLGWRARGELVEWWTHDGYVSTAHGASGTASETALNAHVALMGCVDRARMSGPFGHGAPTDGRRRYQAEGPGPWPAVFPKDLGRDEPPSARPVERNGCALHAVGGTPGIYYVETFVDLNAPRDVIVSVQGALAIFVDDVEVLTRDPRQWGAWVRFGAHVGLKPGRHRLLARVGGPDTAVRLQATNGTPLAVQASDDPLPPYGMSPPALLEDPNVLSPFMVALGVPPQAGVALTSRTIDDPISRVLAAFGAHIEGQDDVSSVLLAPLVSDADRATGPALLLQALFLETDPIYPAADSHNLAKAARLRAVSKDDQLWLPHFWLTLDDADQSGSADALPRLIRLADHFPEVPDLLRSVAAAYGRMGWRVERDQVTRLVVERFPDAEDALRDLVRIYDEEGCWREAEELVARIRKLDPDSDVAVERAIARRDFSAGVRALETLAAGRRDRRDLSARIADLLTRAGTSRESMERLQAAVGRKPLDPDARIALADAWLASGDRGALERALVESIRSGAETDTLREAIELVEGMTELGPYRLNGRAIVAEFEAKKPNIVGTSARVLDYSVIWAHADGSARMLEHEIVAVQSREGIAAQAEQRPHGLVLKLRTLKRDGRVLEPEIVSGKDTVTMSHLQPGDYIETETITTLRGDGQGGQMFEGPRWFFREEKLAYWRGELITIVPKNRRLDVETGGPVPKPEVSAHGGLVVYRWRVDHSPALPEEPGSAPVQEFLPNVRIGWGVDLSSTVARMVDATADETPRDPRLVKLASAIASGASVGAPDEGDRATTAIPPTVDAARASEDRPPRIPSTSSDSVESRAKRIYRWVLSNVEAGRETDGRRVVVGRSGNRSEAFIYLCRLSGITANFGLIRDRLAPPARGPMSEVESFSTLAVRLSTGKGSRWMLVNDRFAPFGYLPGSLRGQPAIELTPGAKHEIAVGEGIPDGVLHEGTVDLAADGRARLESCNATKESLPFFFERRLASCPAPSLRRRLKRVSCRSYCQVRASLMQRLSTRMISTSLSFYV